MKKLLKIAIAVFVWLALLVGMFAGVLLFPWDSIWGLIFTLGYTVFAYFIIHMLHKILATKPKDNSIERNLL